MVINNLINLMRKTKFFSYLIVAIIVVLFPLFQISAQDAQFCGPNRDAIFPDTGLLKVWPQDGPEVLFVTEGLGKGYSSAVISENVIYATGTKDSVEYLTAMELSGNILWQKAYGKSWDKSFPEARTTPTVEGKRVYVHTGLDVLSCFTTEGELIWKVDLHKDYGSEWDMFGVSESPLIVDNMIITTPGGAQTTVVALDKMTGQLVWKSESIGAHRSNMSPLAIDHCGNKYVITATQTHLHGVDIKNGSILWSYHYNFLDKNGDNATIFANTPVYKDSCLWISDGWDTKSVMLQIAPDGKSVSEKYSDHTFDNQNHGVVLIDGFLYGSNFTGRTTGKWVCMNWNSGEIVWIEDFHTKGPILSADGMLYCMEEKRGNIALVKPDPKEFKIVSSFKIEEGVGPFWARPSIYNGMLLIRHGDVLIAYDIKKRSAI
jgi:outer membrane protein assembly factor BamB